jgi:hypothetical protein
MLENIDLFEELNSNIHILRTKLNNNIAYVTIISGADLYYTDGKAVGAFFKIMPYSFYYTAAGEPYYGCSGPDYEMYGVVCNEWIKSIRDA